MFASLLLAPVLLALPADEDALARSGISERDLSKLGKDVDAFFQALDDDDRRAQQEALDKLQGGLDKAAKKAKLDGSILDYVGDLDLLLESAKDPGRQVTGEYGKGFFRHVFADPWDPEGRRVVSLLSVPADAKNGARLPAIVALKDKIGDTGDDLEESLEAMATAAYGAVLEDHIVLIPIGLESGEGRRAESTEVDGSWVGDAGMYVFFTAYRTLLEQVPFDRTRVVLDGWGDAGLDALRLATSTPFFAGLVLRSSPVESPELLYSNLSLVPVMYLQGSDDGGPDGVDALTSADGASVDVVPVEGAALAPGEEVLGKLAAWIGDQQRDPAPKSFSYRLGDVRFGSINWCTAVEINRRVTAQPGDADFPRLEARINGNTIELETVNVLELIVYVSDALVDLDAPVTIKVNGETKVDGEMLNPTLRHVLQTRFWNNSGDYGIYSASRRIEDVDPNLP